MFELVPTKLPHYVLPTIRARTAGCRLGARTAGGNAPRWQTALFYLSLVQFLLGLAVVSAAPVLLPRLYGLGSTWWLMSAAIVAGLLGLGALLAQLRRAPVAAAGMAALAVLVVYPAISSGAAPRLEQLWLSPRAASLAARYAVPATRRRLWQGSRNRAWCSCSD